MTDIKGINNVISKNIAFSPEIAFSLAHYFQMIMNKVPYKLCKNYINEINFLLSYNFMGAVKYLQLLKNGYCIPEIKINEDNQKYRALASNISYLLYNDNNHNKNYSRIKIRTFNSLNSININEINSFLLSSGSEILCIIEEPYKFLFSEILKIYNYDLLHYSQDDIFHTPYKYPISEPGIVKLLSYTYKNENIFFVSKKTTVEKGIRELHNYSIISNKLKDRMNNLCDFELAKCIGIIKTVNNNCYLLTKYENAKPLEYFLVKKYKPMYLMSFIEFLYTELNKNGIGWRDFSPKNILFKQSKSEQGCFILCDFERISFYSDTMIDDSIRTILNLFSIEEFTNCVDKKKLDTIFPIDLNLLNTELNKNYIDSRRISYLIQKFQKNRDKDEEIKLKDLIEFFNFLYIAATPLIINDVHYSFLYPIDILSSISQVKKRIEVMEKINSINNNEIKYELAIILEELSIITLLLYINQSSIGMYERNNLEWQKFGDIALKILASESGDYRKHIYTKCKGSTNIFSNTTLLKLLKRKNSMQETFFENN